MNLPDFSQQVSLHDSTLYSATQDEANRQLVLRITLCRWLQQDFCEDYDELCDVDLVFSGVSEFTGGDHQIKEDGIESAEWSAAAGELVIDVCQDVFMPLKFYSLHIKAADVVVREIRTGAILYG